MKTIARDTFRKHRPGKAGGHNRWVERGMPRIPEHLPSGIIAYQQGQTLKDLKRGASAALDKFKAHTAKASSKPGFFAKVRSFFRRTP